MRAGPGLAATVHVVVPPGVILDVQEVSGDWSRIDLKSGGCIAAWSGIGHPNIWSGKARRWARFHVVCHPYLATAKSGWVNEEIRLYRKLGRSHRVFCLIVDGEPNAAVSGGNEDECFPSALREVDEDMAETAVVEPIAADVRQGGDGCMTSAPMGQI